MPLPTIQLGASESRDQSSAQQDLSRPTAIQIYNQVAENARQELRRRAIPLFISGVAGGLMMGLTGLSVSILLASVGDTPGGRLIAFLLYPLGFMVVIIGRAQLFTENTLYPVALMLAERKHYIATLRLWAVVFPANVLGALLFSLLAAKSGALKPEYLHQLTGLGLEAMANTPAHIFWSGVMGGWIIALVAWLVSASHSITGSVMLIWTMTFVVGIGHFAHCIATSGEILSAVLAGDAGLGSYLLWLLFATAGNIAGGVTLVTILEYGQAKLE
jgi:formate-nitrite transporter family protein